MPSTWTTTLPDGGTKIRLFPPIAQDRWLNIQNGEVPGKKWQLVHQASDPTQISGSGQIYTKFNSGGKSELFYQDDDSHIIRMTNAGGVGYWTQSLYGKDVKLESTFGMSTVQRTNTQNAFCSAWINMQRNGTIQGSYNIDTNTSNTKRLGTGRYVVTLDPALESATNLCIVVTPRRAAGNEVVSTLINNFSDTAFEVRFEVFSGGSYSLDDFGYFAAVIGGIP